MRLNFLNVCKYFSEIFFQLYSVLILFIPCLDNSSRFFLSFINLSKYSDKFFILEKTTPEPIQFAISFELPTLSETKGRPAALDSKRTKGEHSILEVNKKILH